MFGPKKNRGRKNSANGERQTGAKQNKKAGK
jgi:hypothetical protein